MVAVKVVLEGYRRCPDSHDLSECRHLYDLGRHKSLEINLEYVLTLSPLLAAKNLLPPISLTVLTVTPKNYPWKPSGTTLNFIKCVTKDPP